MILLNVNKKAASLKKLTDVSAKTAISISISYEPKKWVNKKSSEEKRAYFQKRVTFSRKRVF